MALSKLDKDPLKQLKKFADVSATPATAAPTRLTVMYLVRFFKHVLGYDSLKEITGELELKEKNCALALNTDTPERACLPERWRLDSRRVVNRRLLKK